MLRNWNLQRSSRWSVWWTERTIADRLLVCQPEFIEDLLHWVATDRRTARRLLELVKATLRDSFEGIGKPEPLKYVGSDVWSRRITQEHRCVYRVLDDRIEFLQGRYHY